MKSIRIAAITSLSIVGDIAGNMARAAHWIRQAGKAGAELVCFPELNITGYCLDPREMSVLAQPIPGPLSDELRGLTRETGMILLAGMVEQNPGGQPYISHCVILPDGEVSVYRKLHLSPRELPGEIDTVVDLTAEMWEAAEIRATHRYLARPILDGHVPDDTALVALVGEIEALAGSVYIHCAEGRGRTGMLAAALLIARGRAPDLSTALNLGRQRRPSLRLSASQAALVERVSAELRSH